MFCKNFQNYIYYKILKIKNYNLNIILLIRKSINKLSYFLFVFNLKFYYIKHYKIKI